MAYSCELCPRRCGADREQTMGFCGVPLRLRCARAALHYWEEPCISGREGSGTVFFSGCTLGCVYCQNYEISHGGEGREITPEKLADIFRALYDAGANNINLVTGTQFTPLILEAFSLYRPPIPVVWNSSGYERVETLRMLEGLVDIYLPDLKHVSPALAALCADAPDYFEYASKAVIEMCRQTGLPVYDERGIMQKGTIVRHLILPGCTADSRKVLDFIAENLPEGTPVSLMRQYTPIEACRVRGLERRITDREYRRVQDYYEALGLSGFTQDAESAEKCYTPPFDLTGILD